jgi:hypothetical protein
MIHALVFLEFVTGGLFSAATVAEINVSHGARVESLLHLRRLVTVPVGIERSLSMARYGKKAAQKVKKAMHERKRGTLKSGRSGKKVTSRKQAIAIGLSEARRAGGKVPRKKAKKK